MTRFDDETDQKGVVLVVFKTSEFRLDQKALDIAKVYERHVKSLPFQLKAVHKCIIGKRAAAEKAADFCASLGHARTLTRTKVHEGKKL